MQFFYWQFSLHQISVLFPLQGQRTLKKNSPKSADLFKSIENSPDNVLQGVYVLNVLDLSVTQQPADNPDYVSNRDGEATQFSLASQFGNVGLLAHNNLAGKSFSRLAPGQEVRLLYENGKTENFIITKVLRYQALEPRNTWSSFRDLDDNEVITAGQLFERVYLGEHHLTFQTCITDHGNVSWGRLFVLATPE